MLFFFVLATPAWKRIRSIKTNTLITVVFLVYSSEAQVSGAALHQE